MAAKVMRLHSKKIDLLPINASHTAYIVKWRNALHVRRMLFSQETLTPSIHSKWLENFVLTKKCYQFIIIDNDQNIPIGTVFLKNFKAAQKNAEFGIFIGETQALGKGFGRAATQLVISYGFASLQLRNIWLAVLRENTSAIKTYCSVGFKFFTPTLSNSTDKTEKSSLFMMITPDTLNVD